MPKYTNYSNYYTTTTRKQKKQNLKGKNKNKFKFSRGVIIGIVIIATAISIISYYSINSMIPVNGKSPILSPPRNIFIKASHSPETGYIFVSQSSGAVKGLRGSGGGGGYSTNPTYTFNKGGVESIHMINEDYETHSKHNFNIDQFNVHTKDLGYFQTQSVTFIADKEGTFQYYCTIHPEMKGNVVVAAQAN
ncbi:MAG TPA: cupredoxin domain-containing protein, partial [Nitrososphaeraceae archaeon]|nr:cupredoxin domain-containing protein [Nitrososphaeraceae archaeon]